LLADVCALQRLLFPLPFQLCEFIPDDAVTPDTTENPTPEPEPTPAPTPEPGTCEGETPTCYNCTTAPFCLRLPSGAVLNAGALICADDDPNKPYCAKGVCSATADDACSGPDAPDSDFLCTDSGYFPDPNDCQKFHFCIGTKDNAFLCSNNYVYSHEKTSCIRRKVSSDCAVIKCPYKTQYQYVLYPKDSNVYGLCIRDKPTLVLKCAAGEQFDIAASQCVFLCKAEGLFPVQGSDTKYRECIRIGLNKYQLVDRECPQGSVFDSDKGPCVIVP
jgi:hypothetical protein